MKRPIWDLYKKSFNITYNDGINALDNDTDDDGVLDGQEDVNHNGALDDYELNPNKWDTDGDSLSDGTAIDAYGNPGEITIGSNPLNVDIDFDKLWDGDEVDPQNISKYNFTNIVYNGTWYDSNATSVDSDDDGLTDFAEIKGWNVTTYFESTFEIIDSYYVYSDPEKNNTDDSDLDDYHEFIHGCDPNKIDKDGDYNNDDKEVNLGTRPCGLDGTPPELNDVKIEYTPVIDNYQDATPFFRGWEINISYEVIDPQYPQFLNANLAGTAFPTVYLQHSFIDQCKNFAKGVVDYSDDFVKSTVDLAVEVTDNIGNAIEYTTKEIGNLPIYGQEVVNAIDNGVSPTVHKIVDTLTEYASEPLKPIVNELDDVYDTALKLANITLEKVKDILEPAIALVQYGCIIAEETRDDYIEMFEEEWEKTKDYLLTTVNVSFNLIEKGIMFSNKLIDDLITLLNLDSGMEWGMCAGENVFKKGDNGMVSTLDDIVELGANYVRVDFSWSSLQPNQPTEVDDGWDVDKLQWFDELLNTSNNKSITVIAILSHIPTWARLLTFPIFKIYWKNYCEKIAKYYGNKIEYYQISNELNHFWHTQYNMPIDSQYPDSILKAPEIYESAYWAIKEKEEIDGDNKFKTIVCINVDSIVGIGWQQILEAWCARAGIYIDIIAVDHYPGSWNFGGESTSQIPWLPVEIPCKMINNPCSPCFGKIGAIMETGYTTTVQNNGEEGQQIFIQEQLNNLRYIVTANKFINFHEIEIGCWYTFKDGSGPDWWIEERFGICRNEWDNGTQKWTRKIGFNDLRTMIDKY